MTHVVNDTTENHTSSRSDVPGPSNRRLFRNAVERSTPLRFRSTPVLSRASLTSSSRIDREIAEGQISTSFSPQSNSTVQENAYPIPTLEEMALDENSNVPNSMSLQNEPQVTDNLQTRRLQTPFGGPMETRRYSRTDLIRVMRGKQRLRPSAMAEDDINELFYTLSARGVENFNPQDLTDFNERHQINLNYGVIRRIMLHSFDEPEPPENDNREAH